MEGSRYIYRSERDIYQFNLNSRTDADCWVIHYLREEWQNDDTNSSKSKLYLYFLNGTLIAYKNNKLKNNYIYIL